MAEAQGATPNTTSLRLVVHGMVAEVTKKTGKDGDTFRTLLKTPAKDSYSSPGTFEVRSKARLGQKGQEVTVECDLLGYARSYDNKDGETVKTAEHILQAA